MSIVHFIVLWFFMGFISGLFFTYSDWKNGYDITIFILLRTFFVTILGVIGFFVAICIIIEDGKILDKVFGKVMIKGKKQESPYDTIR